MRVEIHVARGKDETPAELERILALAMLTLTVRASASAGFRIVGAKKVQQIGFAQTRSTISQPFLIDQQREINAHLIPEKPGVVPVAQANGGQAGSPVSENVLVLAQLRNVLTAEDSPIVTKKDENGRTLLPKRAKPQFSAAGLR